MNTYGLLDQRYGQRCAHMSDRLRGQLFRRTLAVISPVGEARARGDARAAEAGLRFACLVRIRDALKRACRIGFAGVAC
jgi:hypothetical protein